MDAMLELVKSNKIDVKKSTMPALNNGSKALNKNVDWAARSSKGTVKPEEVTKNFSETAKFAAEIKSMFPKDYATITKLRQDLKVHHFDLANQIKDVELMAQTTKDNLRRSVRKLNLRKKYEGTPKLSPSFDVCSTKYEIKTQLADLQTQLEKANAIIKVLEKLQKDCARTADNLNNTLLSLKEQLKKKIEAGKVKVADLQKQAAAAKCNFW
jgi:DNA repair ATPase RecN